MDKSCLHSYQNRSIAVIKIILFLRNKSHCRMVAASTTNEASDVNGSISKLTLMHSFFWILLSTGVPTDLIYYAALPSLFWCYDSVPSPPLTPSPCINNYYIGHLITFFVNLAWIQQYPAKRCGFILLRGPVKRCSGCSGTSHIGLPREQLSFRVPCFVQPFAGEELENSRGPVIC